MSKFEISLSKDDLEHIAEDVATYFNLPMNVFVGEK